MKVTKALTTGIAALALAAPAEAATATLTAAPSKADCSGPGYSGNPFDCQDPPPPAAIDTSQLPSRIGPDGGQDWGRGLPCSTDPRFLGCPGYTADENFLADMARAGITSSAGPQKLIQAAHAICSDLAHGAFYDQEANVLTSKSNLTRDNAIRLVEHSREFYCPAQ
jgi:Protein of unknown function (DUF732)